jgi:hypothetical protein
MAVDRSESSESCGAHEVVILETSLPEATNAIDKISAA